MIPVSLSTFEHVEFRISFNLKLQKHKHEWNLNMYASCFYKNGTKGKKLFIGN